MSALITYLDGALGGWFLRMLWVEIQCYRRDTKILKPPRSIDDLAAPEGERLSDEEWDAWTAAMREARGDD